MVESRDDTEMGEEKQLSIKDIVLMHIRKISQICCQELTGGYMQKKPVKVGDSMVIIEVYHPDLREAYCNAVSFLTDVVYPMADTKFKDEVNKDGEGDELEIKEKLKRKRKIFKEINIMFERYDFFKSTDITSE